jgi:hypothetical protein
MTWTKLGDEHADAAADLSDAAWRTHVEAWEWSNRMLLDLAIPKQHLRRFAFSNDAEKAVEELLATGWWEDRGAVWWVGCRFPEWQRSREQVQVRREQNATAQERRRRHGKGDHSLCLSGKCPKVSAADSARVSAADTSADSAVDPGRVGSGTGNPTTHLGEEHPPEHLPENVCVVCGRSSSFSLINGMCRRCAATPRTTAHDGRAG